MGTRGHHLHPFELGPNREHLQKNEKQAEVKTCHIVWRTHQIARCETRSLAAESHRPGCRFRRGCAGGRRGGGGWHPSAPAPLPPPGPSAPPPLAVAGIWGSEGGGGREVFLWNNWFFWVFFSSFFSAWLVFIGEGMVIEKWWVGQWHGPVRCRHVEWRIRDSWWNHWARILYNFLKSHSFVFNFC